MNDTVIDAPPAAPTTQIAEYSVTAAALAKLKERYSNVAWDLSTTKGDRDARQARLELVKLRTGLEAKRKELKAPMLERAGLIDAEAKRITEELLAIEKPIDEVIKAAEDAKEKERIAKAQAETARLEKIQARLAEIRAAATGHGRSTSEQLQAAIDAVKALVLEESAYEEFLPAANMARDHTLEVLADLLATALHREAEDKRLAEERAELARQREEQRKVAAQQEAAAKAAREAEAARAKAAQDEADRISKEARDKADAEAAAARAEADRIAAEARAVEQARIDAERAVAAAAEAAEQARVQAESAARVAEMDAQHARMSRLYGNAENMLAALRAIFNKSIDEFAVETSRAAIEEATGVKL